MNPAKSIFSKAARLTAMGILGLGIALLTGGIWSGLLIGNLHSTPRIPWSVALMAVVLWAAWQYLGGKGWPRRTAQARRNLLRARAVSRPVFLWSLAAGALGVVALAGLWIVLFGLVPMRPNAIPDMSRYPSLTAALMILMGSLVSPFMEEAGLRGYFQVALEREMAGPAAVLISSAVFAVGHLNHGLFWPKQLVYLLAGVAFGTIALLTKSTLPAIPVHFLGDMTFFLFVWPHDAARNQIWHSGPDAWFWFHAAQAVVFGLLAILAYRRLARAARASEVAPSATPRSLV